MRSMSDELPTKVDVEDKQLEILEKLEDIRCRQTIDFSMLMIVFIVSIATLLVSLTK